MVVKLTSMGLKLSCIELELNGKNLRLVLVGPKQSDFSPNMKKTQEKAQI